MATNSNILAWKILWTEDPGGLQSMGSQRVSQDFTEHIHTPSLTYFFPRILSSLTVLTCFVWIFFLRGSLEERDS